jgi:hypothetical protein
VEGKLYLYVLGPSYINLLWYVFEVVEVQGRK